MKIKIVCLELKFPWKEIKTKNQKQFIRNRANEAFFYHQAKKIFDSNKKGVDINQKSPKSLIENPLYSPSLANYFLDNWTELTAIYSTC